MAFAHYFSSEIDCGLLRVASVGTDDRAGGVAGDWRGPDWRVDGRPAELAGKVEGFRFEG